MNKQTSLLLSILGVISMLLVAVGVTYAFFSYIKEGTVENSITTGTITFIYEEVDKQGAGISIENAYPIPDSIGKVLSDSKEVFNFTVKSQTLNETEIPYTITVKKKDGSTLDEDAVKLYLTEVSGETETPLIESIYQSLIDYPSASTGISEKVLYTTKVPDGSTNYIKNYRLRMWIPTEVDFSPVVDNNENITYPYNDKTFTVTVNVYANGKVVTVPTQPIAYYEFGTPTTSSTTDYTTLGYNVFATLGSDGTIGVCINDDDLLCLKTNDYDNSVTSLKAHFGEDSCTVDDSNFYCHNDVFYCLAYSNGDVNCNAGVNGANCYVNSNGSLNCFQ